MPCNCCCVSFFTCEYVYTYLKNFQFIFRYQFNFILLFFLFCGNLSLFLHIVYIFILIFILFYLQLLVLRAIVKDIVLMIVRMEHARDDQVAIASVLYKRNGIKKLVNTSLYFHLDVCHRRSKDLCNVKATWCRIYVEKV